MQYPLSPENLKQVADTVTVIDVRKPKARRAAGLMLDGSLYRHPFAARDWAHEFIGRKVVVYCVHGHEVSQAVAGFLADEGIECAFLEGGFIAAKEAGFPVTEIADGANHAGL